MPVQTGGIGRRLGCDGRAHVTTVGVMSFAVGPVFNSIWYHRPWRAYLSDVIDARLFSLVMAGVFGLLWLR